MANRLWSFQWKFNSTLAPEYSAELPTAATAESDIPILVPPSAERKNQIVNSSFSSDNKAPYIVNVVNDFPWTYSKPGEKARLETPKIIMIEKRFKTNALISNIIYAYATAEEDFNKLINNLENLIGASAASSFLNVLKSIYQTAKTGADFVFNSASSFTNSTNSPTQENNKESFNLNTALQKTKDWFKKNTQDNNPVLNDLLLKAYKNLYPSANTGWKFVFPYFDDYLNSSQNSFGDDTGMHSLNILKTGVEELRSIAGLAGVLQSPFGFSFQEKAKFYNFPSEGEEFSFTFPLINTGDINFDQVVKNWQLLFLLLYQNKPTRLDRNLVEPPVFYQVSIPGQKFLPFCYITNLSVEFKGSRRELEFKLDFQSQVANETFINPADLNSNNPNLIGPQPQTNLQTNSVLDLSTKNLSRDIKAIIPDAYVVKISLKSLVKETRNFMAYTVLGNDTGDAYAQTTDMDAKQYIDALKKLGTSLIGGPAGSAGGASGSNTIPGNVNWVGGSPYFNEATGEYIARPPEISAPARR